ncbi:MAG: hypothetical protein ACE5J4_00765 [Candidatus Aenigmatarchaeota archaeon]
MRNIVVNTDLDKFLYKKEFLPFPSLDNLSIDQFYILNEKHYGIYDEILDVTKTEKDWRTRIEELVKIAGKHEISFDEYIESAERIIKVTGISRYLKSVLEELYPIQMNVFTGSGSEAADVYISKIIQPQIPKTKIDVYGTTMEFSSEKIITGNVLNLWDSESRARKAKELTGNRKSVNIGNGPNDILMLRDGNLSFYLGKDHKIENNIIYTDLKNLPLYLKSL